MLAFIIWFTIVFGIGCDCSYIFFRLQHYYVDHNMSKVQLHEHEGEFEETVFPNFLRYCIDPVAWLVFSDGPLHGGVRGQRSDLSTEQNPRADGDLVALQQHELSHPVVGQKYCIFSSLNWSLGEKHKASQ